MARYIKFVPWFKCQYIWFPDDDMEMAVADLLGFFRVAEAAKLDVRAIPHSAGSFRAWISMSIVRVSRLHGGTRVFSVFPWLCICSLLLFQWMPLLGSRVDVARWSVG